MGLNSYKKKLSKIFLKKGFDDNLLIDAVVDNLSKSQIDLLIVDISSLSSYSRLVSKINSYLPNNKQFELTSNYRVKKYRATTKKVSLQMMVDKSIKNEFDNLKKELGKSSEELLNILIQKYQVVN